MVLALEHHWVWDSWYAHDGDKWHVFFLKADKSLINPELRHFNVTQGHAVSDDLVNWEDLGTCLTPSPGPAWDDFTTWTGSVVRDDAGLWHLFYTGTSKADQGLYQRIGHATSDDLHTWQRLGDGLCLDLTGPNAAAYEADLAKGLWPHRAMRDPWVMRNPDGHGWLMFFTARASGITEPNAGGAIGLATSDDLMTWTLQSPVFVGGYGQLEVPQVFEVAGRWYCLFCTAAEHFCAEQAATIPGGPVTGNHYLMADSPLGPWTIAPGPFLDGALPCRRYAARIVETPAALRLMGFADTGADGQFEGVILDPEPVEVLADGRLMVHAQPMAAT
ncbi:MAG: levansucrase [Roseinatronobacter sp.]